MGLEHYMPENNLQSSAKLLDENISQIFNQYQNRQKSLETSFKILLLFSLLFLFIIQIPYISIRVRNDRISTELDESVSILNKKAKLMDDYKQAQAGIEDLHKQINESPRLLALFLQQLNEPRSNAMFVQQPLHATNEPMDFRVRNEVIKHFEIYRDIFRQKILAPLKLINKDDVIINQLEKGLDTLQIVFHTKLDSNPDFFYSFSGKGGFYSDLDKDVKSFWDRFSPYLAAQQEKLNTELISMNKSCDSLKQTLHNLKADEEQIVARMDQIEFPLGKIPIGLNESIAVFPLLISIGFLLFLSLFSDTILLRRKLHDLYKQKDPARTVFTEEQISLVAPLWIDPLQPKQNQRLKFLLLSVPFIIFVLSVSIIIYTWMLPGPAILDISYTWWIYSSVYLLCFILCVSGFRKILKELSGYNL